MHVDERKDILYRVRDLLRVHADELVHLECLNTGIPVHHIRGHVTRVARNFEFFAEVASTVSGETYTQAKGYLTYVTREPRGVAALIAPWNAPLALASMRVATCIAFGNTCVLKPSEYTPLVDGAHGGNPARGRAAAGRREPRERSRHGHRQRARRRTRAST